MLLYSYNLPQADPSWWGHLGSLTGIVFGTEVYCDRRPTPAMTEVLDNRDRGIYFAESYPQGDPYLEIPCKCGAKYYVDPATQTLGSCEHCGNVVRLAKTAKRNIIYLSKTAYDPDTLFLDQRD
jgi:hypothetical protein